MYEIDAAVVLGLTYPPLYSGSPETNKTLWGECVVLWEKREEKKTLCR
jgi:hypothetical protein